MKCHYEILNVPRDADFDEIKKSYRRLAIKWHPDKNLDNTSDATEQFQLIQQAFEVLSDPHERKWYDDHREAILKGKSGGQYDDESLNVYEFFTSTCFKGYGDDRKGFYAIYREVFNKIAAEDSEYQTNEESDFEIPTFGKSDSSFEDVNAFYAYWQSYSTKKSYAWLDPYDARNAPNRRVSRLIESENKKVRDKARKARNEEIRELVGFVRKRDKRVQAYAQHLKDVAAQNAKKAEEQRIRKIKERNEELASFQESEWSKFSNVEKELKNLEANLAAEFGDHQESDDASDEENDLLDSLYCIACEKLFKNPKAFENHETSKKHKENVQRIKNSLKEISDEEEDLSVEEDFSEDEDDIDNQTGEEADDNNGGAGVDDSDIASSVGDIKISKSSKEEEKSVGEAMKLETSDSDKDSISDNEHSSLDTFSEYVETLESDNSISVSSTSTSRPIHQKPGKQSKKQRKKNRQSNKLMSDTNNEKEDVSECLKSNQIEIDMLGQLLMNDLGLSKKQRKKQQQKNILIEHTRKDRIDSETAILEASNNTIHEHNLSQTTVDCTLNQTTSNPSNASSEDSSEIKSKQNIQKLKKKDNIENSCDSTILTCQVCKSKFTSKNKLFQHLEKTKHAVAIPDKSTESSDLKNIKANKISNSKKKSRK